MKNIRIAILLLVSAVFFSAYGEGEQEKLLPTNTVLLITIPDYTKSKEVWDKHPQAQLFKDPSLQAAKEKFLAKWRSEVVDPLEKELGIKFSDYTGLAKGQITFALTFFTDESKKVPFNSEYILIVDSGENKESLTRTLNGLVQKYTQSNHEVTTNKINGLDCYEFVINSEEVSKIIAKVFPDPSEGWESLDGPKPKPKNVKHKINVCQVDSLLILGNSTNLISTVVLNKSGKSQTSLFDNPGFKDFYDSRPKDSLLCLWADLEPVEQKVISFFTQEEKKKQNQQGGFDLTPRKIFESIGIFSLKGVTMTVQNVTNGSMMNLFIRSPESDRAGLLKALLPEQKDSTVPPFVPSNVVSFVRYRLDMQKAWGVIESTLEQIDPKIPTVLNLMLQTAGKAKNPNFDWRKDIIGALGNDIVIYVKNPQKATIENINKNPRVVIINSTNPEQLCNSIKGLTALSPKPPEIKEREMAGKKVYYWESPRMLQNPDKKQPPQLTFITANGNNLVIANEAAILQEYLNFAEGKSSQLKNLVGLNELTQQVGANSGVMLYQNSREQMRFQYNLLKNETDTLATLLAMTPIGIRLGLGEDSKLLRQWIDPTLLPDYSKIEKYFYITVSGLTVEKDGIRFKSFSPIPPELMQANQ
ncbi:MAG: hypothetical protein ACP5T0_03660 [Verrucomicrobiia bacterium]